jgi:hypothetical protein
VPDPCSLKVAKCHNSQPWAVAYAVRVGNMAINATPSMQDPLRHTLEELFKGTRVSSNPKHWVTFGCPTHVLKTKLQGMKPLFASEGSPDLEGAGKGIGQTIGQTSALAILYGR